MNYKVIEEFVDFSIQDLVNPDFDFFYIDKSEITDSRFIDESKPPLDNTVAWKAVSSLINETEILDLEAELKFSLPPSFKHYLKYKNFYALGVISHVWMFAPLIPEIWKQKIVEDVFEGYPREFLFDKGLIPFADYSDWGKVCFNINKVDNDGEFEIIRWDHDDPENPEFLASNFVTLLESIVDNYKEGIASGTLIIK